jgi:hypothetical protein
VNAAWSVLLVLATSAVLAALAAVSALRRAARDRARADELRDGASTLELRAQLARRAADLQMANVRELRQRIAELAGRDPEEPDDALLEMSPRELRRALRRRDEEVRQLGARACDDEAAHDRRVRALLARIEDQGKLITSLVEALADTTQQLEDVLRARLRGWRDRPRDEVPPRPPAASRATAPGDR